VSVLNPLCGHTLACAGWIYMLLFFVFGNCKEIAIVIINLYIYLTVLNDGRETV
jgi:hypothetical protein